MKATLKTYGGFAPGLLPRPRAVDASRLDAPRAHHFESLLAKVHGGESGRPAPDERRYELAIEDCGECRTVRCGDSTMSSAFAEIVAFIEAHGEPAGG